MNENNEIVTQDQQQITATTQSVQALSDINLIYNPEIFGYLEKMSGFMAASGNAVPQWLRNNPGGCMSICILAWQNHCNPFGLAGDSFCVTSENGSTMGVASYGAKATHAIVERACGSGFEHDFFGDWDRIIGKVKQITGKNGKPYYVPAWDRDKDEEGLGVWVWLRSDPDRKLRLLMKQCQTRNSTNWANNPQLQLFYQACKVWARMYKPGAVLGITSVDEIEDNANVLPTYPTPATVAGNNKKTGTKKDALKSKLGINPDEAVNAEVVEENTQPKVSERVQAIIDMTGAPVTVDKVVSYLQSLGYCTDYGLDEIDQYPENFRNRMAGDLTNLVNQAAEFANK